MSKEKECKTAANAAQEQPSVEGENKTAKRGKKKNKVRTVVAITVVSLAASAIAGLSVALYFSQDINRMQANYMREMEAVYSRNYYDLLDSANNLDTELSKLNAASTVEAQREILYDVWSAATAASTGLSAFQGGEDGVMKATKFVGQLGDYAHYLAKRMEDGEPLSAEERQTLGKLREMAGVLKDALQSTGESINRGELFLGDGGILESFTSSFDAFAEPNLDYPQMIYDGPFSDSLEHRECKALKGLAEITPEEGVELIGKYIPDATDVKYYDKTEGDIVTLNYSVSSESGEGFVQLTEKGGMLVSYNVNYERASVDAGYPEHCAAAIRFAENAGFESLTSVWCSQANGIVFVNLAPVQNGVVLYPDLIKVKVDEASGKVIGLDAMHYAFNHTERSLPSPALTQSQAAEKVVLPVVSSPMLALIPLDETREVLTYEFECESGGTYFVYIDAMTGEESNILYVIDSEQGTVLM